ncbi:unnamed protein product [Lathyrus sativus]|nr:unnamed protein product [Lathyrus sativus]
MRDRDWVNLALADDSIVADTLLRFNLPQPPPPPLHLHWTVRQPRSRSLPKLSAKLDFTRASPTTPLTWSAATSASEESSLPTKLTKTSRSKVSNQKETVTTKNSKRKKTLAELREEESLLLKERINLKNELASLRLTVEKEKATNERLKRVKLDFDSRPNTKTASTSEICKQEPKFALPDLNL